MTNSPEKEPSSHNGQRRSGIRLIPHYPRLSEDDRYWAKMEDQWRSEADTRNLDLAGSGASIYIRGGDYPRPPKIDRGIRVIPGWVINLLLLLQGANLCIGILTWVILRGL